MNYPKLAGQLAVHFPLEKLHPDAAIWLSKHSKALPKNETWAIACSGGADSVCLLMLIYAHFPQMRSNLRILHFNHRMRGADSDADAAFIRELTEGLNCELQTGQSETPNNGSEASARESRFAFFKKAMQTHNAHLLFLGHNKNDIAETLFMRLARGSGTSGLAAPRPIHKFPDGTIRLRPLLSLEKKTITHALRQTRIPWREDTSNQTDDYFRNRIRKKVLPAWIQAAPTNPLDGAQRSRQLLEEDDSALESWLDSLLVNPLEPNSALDLAFLLGKPRALFRRVLHRWLLIQNLAESLNATAFESLLKASIKGIPYKVSCGSERFLTLSKGILSIQSCDPILEWSSFYLSEGSKSYLPDGSSLQCQALELTPQIREHIQARHVDDQQNVFIELRRKDHPTTICTFRVRQWQNGDRYRPLGAPGTAKLQDIFTNRKMAVRERRALPLICLLDGTIVWCPGLPPAEELKIKTCSKKAIKITYRKIKT